MAWRLFCLMSFAVLLVTVSTTPAGIIIEVPSGAYPTIQAGIDAAGSGDIVLVYPGMYTGDGNRDLNFLGKAITVRSIDPNDPCVVAATVIDCNGTEEDHHQGFLFQNGEEPNSVLEGFTITKAYARPPLFPGGGISLVMSNPTIRQCIITNNSEYDAGGGIGALLSDFTLSHCTITNNSAYMEGAGIHAFESDFTLSHCTIKNNTITYDGSGPAGGGAGIAFLQSSPKIEHCIISDNSGANVGGGIYCYIMSSPIITHCIITGNSANDKGGGIFSYNSK
jgi:parallel beta-helix repeat protein